MSMSTPFTSATTASSLAPVKVSHLSVEEERRGFEGVLALVGQPTSDGRYLIPGEISHRELPLPFLVQTQTAEGHLGAEVAGRIETIEYIPIDEFERSEEFGLGEVREGAIVVFAHGTLDGSEHADDAERMISNGAGVSIDLPPERVAPFDPDTLEEVPEEEISFEDLVFGHYLTGIAGKIAAATIVSIPAFEQASVKITDESVLVASAYGLRMVAGALTASAAPLHPPREWFFTSEFPGPTPLTVTEEGRVFGHLATWDTCHIGIDGVCTRAPRSRSGYAFFHSTGAIKTAEGEEVEIGKLMLSVKHAPLGYNRAQATQHYDDNGKVGAYVRASDGRYGIWLSGVVRHDLSEELLHELRCNRPSGDWRDVNGSLELVAACAVPVQGFPVARAEAALTASADEITISALIASSGEIVPSETVRKALEATGIALEPSVDIPTYRRRLQELSERRKLLSASAPFYWEPGGSRWEAFKDYPAAERKKMAKDGRALPDGSFPIADCSDAEDAIRSQGRAAPNKRAQVRAHIRKRVKALGCEGDIFEPYK